MTNTSLIETSKWCEVTKEEIYNAMLLPGEYKEENGKFYIKPGMLDGYVVTFDKEN